MKIEPAKCRRERHFGRIINTVRSVIGRKFCRMVDEQAVTQSNDKTKRKRLCSIPT